VGNTIADGDRLATQIGSKHPFLYLFGGEYDRKKVEEDVEKLTNYYRGLGFFRARVGHELEFNQKENWVTIRFVIDEGPRYKVRNVSVIGNKKYGTEELLGESKLKVTNYFNQASMDADTRAISDKYGSVGYVFADIKPDLRFLEEPGQLDIVYNISEGDRYRVGKINIQIKGEYSHTQENTVRNRLFFKPGDIVDIREIRASEVALKRSQLFESNPAQGNAPKIVFTPPDQDGMIRENDKRQQMAGRPRTPDSPDSRFRGQSPDSDSCDRELNLVIDCGRLVARPIAPPPAAPVPPSVGAVGYGETMVAPNAGAANGAYAPRAEAMQVGYEASSAEAAPSELDLAVQAYSEALSRAEQQRARVQYLAPDDSMANQGALPRNDAPGDYAQPSRFDNGPSAVQPQEESLDEEVRGVSAKAAAVAAEKEARQLQGTRPRIGLLETQYSSGGGQVNPATTSNPFQQWRSPTASGNENRQTAPSYVASRPESAPYPATNGSMVSQQIPASPMPGNGVDGAGPNGQEAVTQSPQGHMVPGPIFSPDSPFNGGAPDDGGPPARPLDIDIRTEETMTGKLMFGVGVNSDAGLVGSVVLDEQNFDWTRFPNSWEDVRNASAWRGAGQRFRIEAVPGTQVQRYMVSFAEPYMFGTQVSNGLSGYFFNRIYSEYNEQRLGGRVSFGYQFSPSLAGGIAYRGAKVNITDPADPFLPALAEVTGRDLALHGFQLSMQHDTRDNAFLATEGHLIEGSVEQVLGSFQYPQALLDIRKYFTMYERPDGSGRHVLSLSTHFGWTGDNTPIYERFYSGGFSTIRGFQFRRASPLEVGPSTGTNIVVGGNFQMLASAEYMFPITADDMVRGVIFCDTGTTEPSINDWSNKYRVAPGFGLRISVPAMGPAPIALDFAFPVSWQPGDKSELFSFFMGFGR
jgi:outer membrane protein insertion porin family